jgi:hypothetical protein
MKLNNIHNGFKIKEILRLNKKKKSLVPHIFLHSKIYSLHKCISEYVNWPKFLPIPVYHDHGMTTRGFGLKDEKYNDANYHITWHHHRKRMNLKNKKIISIEHPYIEYRKKRYIKKKNAKGSIFFIPHSNPNIKLIYNLDKIVSKLRLLEKKYQPLVMCISGDDIDNGFINKIQKYKLPIVTVGNSNNIDFVDNFYQIISNFKFACSNDIGSFLPLCHEFGLKVFLIGNKFVNFNLNNQNFKLNEEIKYPLLQSKIRKEFNIKKIDKKSKKDIIVNKLLNINLKKDPRILRIFFYEFLKFIPRIVKNFYIKLRY